MDVETFEAVFTITTATTASYVVAVSESFNVEFTLLISQAGAANGVGRQVTFYNDYMPCLTLADFTSAVLSTSPSQWLGQYRSTDLCVASNTCCCTQGEVTLGSSFTLIILHLLLMNETSW